MVAHAIMVFALALMGGPEPLVLYSHHPSHATLDNNAPYNKMGMSNANPGALLLLVLIVFPLEVWSGWGSDRKSVHLIQKGSVAQRTIVDLDNHHVHWGAVVLPPQRAI